MKKCKHCRSDIDDKARVCPICKRAQSGANNPILLIPIFLLIGFLIWFFFSSTAPTWIKEVNCSLGLRDGEYCVLEKSYKIEFQYK